MEEEKQEPRDDSELARKWISELERAEKYFKPWEERVKKIVKRYRDERSNIDDTVTIAHRLNIFWSNIQTLQPALYSRTPKPVVERRFKDPDPVGRLAGEILERALSFQLDLYDFDTVMKECRDDYLLAGRGIAWVEYNPIIKKDVLTYQEATCRYVHWKDFLHTPARFWIEVTWVAKKVFLNKKELEANFSKEVADHVPLDYNPQDSQDTERQGDTDNFKKACIYEIWDKETKQQIFISKGYSLGTLKVVEDPLRLRNFFPCPQPLYATLTTDSLIPVPDFELYKDQLGEIDNLTYRSSSLTESIRAIGMYDSSLEQIEQLFQTDDYGVVPVDNWAAVVERGGLEGAIAWLPIDQMVKTLQVLHEMRKELVGDVYEVTGLADIIRGNTSPQETATAQQIKGQFATLRISERQMHIQRFARDLIELKAEIMAEHFDPAILLGMSGLDPNNPQVAQILPYVFQLLKNDVTRNYRIDIETDSTVAVDEQMDKQRRIEWLEATGRFIQQALTLAQTMPALLPALTEMILFAARGFKEGRMLESTLEQAFQAVNQQVQQQMQAQAQQEAPPDPKMLEVQAKAQLDGQRFQLDQHKVEMQGELDMKKLQLDGMLAEAKARLEIEKLQSTLVLEAEKARAELALKAQELENVPENKQTQDTVKQASMPSIEVNVHKPSKKIATFVIDPLSGKGSASIEEVPEITET